MRAFFLSVILLGFVLVQSSHAQWAWSKGVGISGSTAWDAVTLDDAGNFYFSGHSDKLAGNPSRAYVTAKYNDTARATWNSKLLSQSSAFDETSNGVDAAGNSYMISVFMNAPIKLPDGSEISYFLKSFFVAKFQPDGKLAWAKRLVIPDYSYFHVMQDGTVGIHAMNVGNFYLFGTDSISTPGGGGDCYIEIKSDGTIGRSVRSGDLGELTTQFVQWKEPGKLFAIGVSGPTYGPWLYQRGTIDLDAKTFTAEGTPLSVTGAPNTVSWNNTFTPNSPTIVLEPKSGHIFTLMSAFNSDVYLNLTDTIHFKTNTQILDAYVVELDDQMKVVRKVHLTNPLQLAVRDSQVVVTAIVRATSGFGFVTPDTTIKITRTSYNVDGVVVYVMDRQFHYRKHALVETEPQTQLGPYATLIGANGEVYVSLFASGTLFFQGQPAFPGHSGTVLARLSGGGGLSEVKVIPDGGQFSVYPNPVQREFTVEQPGTFRYVVCDLLGNSLTSGRGADRAIVDMAHAPAGTYFLVIESEQGKTSRLIQKVRE